MLLNIHVVEYKNRSWAVALIKNMIGWRWC